MSLKMAILGFTSKKPTTGYEIHSYLEKLKDVIGTAKLPQIYREIKSLESKGLIFQTKDEADMGREDRKTFSATPEGKMELEDWLHSFPAKLLPEPRDDFMLRLFFKGTLAEGEVKVQLERFITERELDLKRIPEMEKLMYNLSEDEDHKYQHFIIKRAYVVNEALIGWAKNCINEIHNDDTPPKEVNKRR